MPKTENWGRDGKRNLPDKTRLKIGIETAIGKLRKR